jgi:hypothetical protein
MAQPMKRKRLILFACLSGALIVGALLAYYFIFPRLVRVAVRHTLAGAGVTHVDLHVSSASLWHARLANLIIGETQTPIEIKNVGLHYTPAELLGGNLNAIVLSGLTVALTIKDGRIDLGPITPILERRAKAATQEAQKPPPTNRTRTLPVDRIILRDSTLLIHTPRATLQWPMNAALLVNRNRKYALNLTLRTRSEFTVSGTIDPSDGAIDLTAGGEEIRAEMLGQVLEGLVQRELPLSGMMDAEAHFQWNNGAGTLSGTIKPNDLAYANLGLASGVLQVDTTLGGPAPAAKLAISDVQAQAAETKIDGVNGTIAFSSLRPLATATGQLIRIDQLTIGQLEMTDGTIQFDMHSPQLVHVDGTRWNVLGGAISAAPFDFTPADPQLQVTLRGDQIDLKALLDLFGQGKVTGSGLLSGEIPLTIGPGGVTFGRGALFATKDGQLHVKDLSALAETLGAQSGGSGKNQSSAQQVRQNIIEALSDFQYDDLQADLRPDENGKPMAVIHLAGHGTKGAKQAIDLDLRIRGIEDIARVVLNIRSRMSDAAQSKGG